MKDAPVIVTIDGPAGVGKSTLAGRVAQALGVAYLDTGAMFRTVALHLARSLGDADIVEGPALQALLDECVFSLEGTGAQTRLLCNGRVVGEEIRSEQAGMMAAKVASIAQVRTFLKGAQQALGAKFSLVAEGRDMGTVVFPAAASKIFLDARPEVRAQRRYLQLREKGEACDLAELTALIAERDTQDRTRAVAPLKAADDATVIDTSDCDTDQVFAAIMRVVRAQGDEGPPVVPMRRKDRALTDEQSLDVLARAEYGTLGLADAGGWPYAVPLSFVLLDGALYFHCARAGRKNMLISRCDKVCFTAVCDTEPVYMKGFTTRFKSVMVFGRAAEVRDDDERYKALHALAEKYLPGHMDKADGDIRQSFARTMVYRISMDAMSGKSKLTE